MLFLIHDLGRGGAEKVLVNLVNNMDPEQFDISVIALFGGGVNEQYLEKYIRYRAVFPRMIPGNTHLMKLLSPQALHMLFVREHYDIEVSYLEGPSARVISGCPDRETKLVCWIHVEQKNREKVARSFRSYEEALQCYDCFDRLVGVSETVREDFLRLIPTHVPMDVLYNTNESEMIKKLSSEAVEDDLFPTDTIKLVGVGRLVKTKGFDRLLRIFRALLAEGYPAHLYLLGVGPEEETLRGFVRENELQNSVSFLGYQTNPYRYVSRCDLFVCASHAEGFSTAATEALILGVPVCTTEVSGMREMLGDSEYGLITENSDEALYEGLKRLLSEPSLLKHYRSKAGERGERFSTGNTVKAVEDFLLRL